MLRIEDAFSLSEAGSQCISYRRQSPGCGRYAPLARGYGKFSLFEAVTPGGPPREVRCPGRSAALSGHCVLVPGGPLLREVRCPQRTIEYQFERYLVVWPLRAAALPGSGPPGEPACFEGFSQECRITAYRVLSCFYTVFVGYINNPSASFFQQVGRINIDKK